MYIGVLSVGVKFDVGAQLKSSCDHLTLSVESLSEARCQAGQDMLTHRRPLFEGYAHALRPLQEPEVSRSDMR